MSSGRLNAKATFERATITRDTDGGVVETWAKLFDRSVGVMNHKGREFFLAAQVQSDLAEIVIAPWSNELATVTSKDRLTLKGRTLNIASVENAGERNRELLFRCKETT